MKKKVISIVLAVLMGLTLIGCQSFEDLVPEEYGEWDGTYIYRANGRSKTTGEDYETLVQQVTVGETIYNVMGCRDYAIAGDSMYLCLELSANNAEFTTGLVYYDIRSKTSAPLVVEKEVEIAEERTKYIYKPYAIEKLYEDKILLSGQRQALTFDEDGNVLENAQENVWYSVDLYGTMLEMKRESFLGYTWVGEEYFMRIDSYSEGATA